MSIYRVLAALTDGIGNGSDIRRMLDAHLQKPLKTGIYYDALTRCVINGRLVFIPTWSWWAFFGGAFYYYYRKMYVPGTVFLALWLALLVVPIPFVSLAAFVAAAIPAKYLYVKKFIWDLDISGYPDRSPTEITSTLERLGGYNNWAIVAGVVLNFFYLTAAVMLFFGVIGLIGIGVTRLLLGGYGITI